MTISEQKATLDAVLNCLPTTLLQCHCSNAAEKVACEAQSVTAALRLGGVTDYTRASTRINAKLASATQALHLRVAEGAPILRTINLNVDDQGQPLEYGRTWFAGDKVTLTRADT